MGVAPLPPLTPYTQFRKQTQWQVQTGRDRIKNGRGGVCIGGNAESRGAGTDQTQGSPRQLWHRLATKGSCLEFSCRHHGALLRPLFQGICGLPSLGRATIATATGFPESLHCSSISGYGGAAPPGPALQPQPLMTVCCINIYLFGDVIY